MGAGRRGQKVVGRDWLQLSEKSMVSPTFRIHMYYVLAFAVLPPRL